MMPTHRGRSHQRVRLEQASYFQCVQFYKQSAALVSIILITTIVWPACVFAQTEPLPSWNDTAAKKAIVEFVEKVTKEDSSDFVKPEARIVTFDNDGTLWVGTADLYPSTLSPSTKSLRWHRNIPNGAKRNRSNRSLAHDREAMLRFSIQDFEKVVAVTHSGMTVQQFQEIVKKWLAEAKHPRFKRPYTECVYQR